MKIFLLGDFESNNGPGNANRKIRDSIPATYNAIYSQKSSKIGRIVEMYIGILKSDVLIICSKSDINYWAIKIAKRHGKKIVYLMHGYASYELQIANPVISARQLRKIKKYESFVYEAADRIVCVSKRFMEYMQKQLPQYSRKLDYIYNIVDIHSTSKFINHEKTRQKKVLSVGGGMRRKNNLTIAKTIDQYIENIEYIVVGAKQEEGEEIQQLNCVSWIDYLSHDSLFHLMQECDLYVQNSSFETFGLSVIEALYAGCSLLISDQVGCIDLFSSISDIDIIYDVSDKEEIKNKIEYLLQNPNHDRLLTGFQREKVSKTFQINRWEKIIREIYRGENIG